LKEYCSFLNSLNIEIAQYRNKSGANLENDLKLIKSFFHGKLILNDYISYIDLADGLHLGQQDLEAIHPNKCKAFEIVRKKIKNKIFGISTHNLDEIYEANSFNLDYIGLGAYRKTETKKDIQGVYGNRLIEIAQESLHDVALIGGVKLSDFFDEKVIKYKVIGTDLFKKFINSKKY